MAEEKQYNRNDSDHDLLITLNTRFEHFTQQVQTLLDLMQNKADKADLREVRTHMKDNSERIARLEVTHRDQDTKKKTLISIGKFGIDTWQLIMGSAVTLLTIWQLVQAFAM